jgi:LPS export ABC transporter protein LptC
MGVRSRNRRWGGAVAALAAIGLAAGACSDGPQVVAGTFMELPADQVAFDMEVDIKDLGVLRARLHADTAHIWEDIARMATFPVDLRLFDDNGAQTARLTAHEGELESRRNVMVARGNVVLVTTDGQKRLITEELHYDPSTRRLWSDVHTVFYDGDTRLEGAGFRADDGMNDVQIFQSTGDNIPFGS